MPYGLANGGAEVLLNKCAIKINFKVRNLSSEHVVVEVYGGKVAKLGEGEWNSA